VLTVVYLVESGALVKKRCLLHNPVSPFTPLGSRGKFEHSLNVLSDGEDWTMETRLSTAG
jgi:hypothetical protein